jgi:hypothetical protein
MGIENSQITAEDWEAACQELIKSGTEGARKRFKGWLDQMRENPDFDRMSINAVMFEQVTHCNPATAELNHIALIDLGFSVCEKMYERMSRQKAA